MQRPRTPAAPDPDWRRQLRQSIRDREGLLRLFPEAARIPGIAEAAARFPMAITPYYAGLIRRADYADPVFAQCVPRACELRNPPWLEEDPLGEKAHAPRTGLVHRYKDRLLLLATPHCAGYCRHCTRKWMAGSAKERPLGTAALREAAAYLSEHPEISDVLVSGGDPLTLATPALERILKALRSAPSVQVIRIASRTPVTLPMRIDRELVRMLRRHAPLYLNTHFNHPVELTAQAAEALARLADAGIPLANQTVLLRGVNDSPRTLETLFRELLRHRVRPYYLFQCDLVRGIEHFRTPLQTGLDIMRHLRANLDGLGIPHFVLDTPGGGGKIELLPDAVVSREPGRTWLRNPGGDVVSHPEPLSAPGGAAPP